MNREEEAEGGYVSHRHKRELSTFKNGKPLFVEKVHVVHVTAKNKMQSPLVTCLLLAVLTDPSACTHRTV